jgi:hypothetical protein
MENKGFIEIHISGKKGQLQLSPDMYDISELRGLLDYAEQLLFPAMERKSRPIVSYEIKDGSVRHIFTTSLQVIIGFNAVLGQIQSIKNINFLEYSTAKAIYALQETARKQNYSFEISTSIPNTTRLIIDPSTDYSLPDNEWVSGEFYFYGDITNMGGKTNPNVHVSVPGLATFKIQTPRDTLAQYDHNPLYKPLGVRATGRQNIATGEIDSGSLAFVEFIDYSPDYDEKYLDSLINKAQSSWADVPDADAWLRELRGEAY